MKRLWKEIKEAFPFCFYKERKIYALKDCKLFIGETEIIGFCSGDVITIQRTLPGKIRKINIQGTFKL